MWCIKVPTGAFIARRNGQIFCTGNSGFPKSHDVSKAIDKMDATEAQQERRHRFTEWVRSQGVTSAEIDEATGTNMGGHYTTSASQPAIMTREHLEACRHLFANVPEWVEKEVDIRSVESKQFAEREVVQARTMTQGGGSALQIRMGEKRDVNADITAPATPEAEQWDGWGTALKPALEPICVARKPFSGTVAENVLEHGTGALNVDGCRVEGPPSGLKPYTRSVDQRESQAANHRDVNFTDHPEGRWPANLIHDGSDEATKGMGEAARFFYCAKASKADRGSFNDHPTVKPTDLMRYLCRLVTPPGGLVLDPFMGSGSTGKAAVQEGFRFVGIEKDAHSIDIARRRIFGQTIGLQL